MMKSYIVSYIIFLLVISTFAKEWKLIWSPEAEKDGLKAFEHVEDERGKVHNVKHILVEGNNYRFNMHVQDRDSISDRQRQEVLGMAANGQNIRMKKGETWKFTYSMFIPDTLKATSSFTHIAQMKDTYDNGGGAPIYVMSLRRHEDSETIEAQVTTDKQMLGSTNLKALHEKWIDVELEYHVDDVHGSANLTLISDTKSVLHGSKDNVKTFFHDEVRPKWGIYRSLNDTKQLIDTYFLITKLRGYKFE